MESTIERVYSEEAYLKALKVRLNKAEKAFRLYVLRNTASTEFHFLPWLYIIKDDNDMMMIT